MILCLYIVAHKTWDSTIISSNRVSTQLGSLTKAWAREPKATSQTIQRKT
ncbi:unnamed protein product, partial [Pylaiella littoralis]